MPHNEQVLLLWRHLMMSSLEPKLNKDKKPKDFYKKAKLKNVLLVLKLISDFVAEVYSVAPP